MKRHDSINPDDWKRVARKDWGRVKRNLRDDDPEAAGFYLQQSLEKYLKAFLLQHGWRLRKIHELHYLLGEAVVYNQFLESFRKLCERVSGYYMADRYPFLTPSELSCEDIENHLEEAKKFIRTMFPGEKLDG